MTSQITIRRGEEQDIPAFLAFFRKSLPILFKHYSQNILSFTLDVDYGPSWLTDRLKKGGKRTYLALSGDEIVGYILSSKPIAGVSFADWLGVDVKFQRKGTASRLLSLWEKEALTEGVHALHLWTTENNVEFYKKRGFACGGTFPKAWHGEDCYLIYKSIAEPDEKNFLRSYLEKVKKG